MPVKCVVALPLAAEDCHRDGMNEQWPGRARCPPSTRECDAGAPCRIGPSEQSPPIVSLMTDQSNGDSFAQIYVLGLNEPYRIYPAWFSDDSEVSVERALREPQSVYENLQSDTRDPLSRFPIAYFGWPEILLFLSGAAASGVTGNAAYDAFKAAVRTALSRTSGQARSQQHLSKQDAIELARTFVRSWQADDPGRVRTGTVFKDSRNNWIIDVRKGGVVHTVTIPPGPLEGAKVRISRRDGRSSPRRVADRSMESLRLLWWRIRYRD